MPLPGFNPQLGPDSNVPYGAASLRFPAGDPIGRGGQFRARRDTGVSLFWYGEAVEARIAAAALVAVKEIAEMAAEHARENHPWRNRSGDTETSIFVGESRISDAGVALCSWGAAGAAVFLEYGTVKMPAYPFLRPAQDATYPHLAGRMAVELA